MATIRPSKRQEAKQRSKQLKDLHFVVQWLDGCESPMYDTIQARDLVPPMEMDVLDVTEGVECQARFNQRFYRIRVIASGKYVDMKQVQSQKENEAKDDDSGAESPMEENQEADLEPPLTQENRDAGHEQSFVEEAKNHLPAVTSSKPCSVYLCGFHVVGGAVIVASCNKPCSVYYDVLAQTLKKQGHRKEKSKTIDEQEAALFECRVKSPAKSHGRKKLIGVQGSSKVRSPNRTPQKSQLGPKTPRKGRSDIRRGISTSSEDSDEELNSGSKKSQFLKTPSRKRKAKCHSEPELPETSDSEEEVPPLEARRALNIAENDFVKQMIGLSPGMPTSTLMTEVTRLKEKMRLLKKSQEKLKVKVGEQQKEIKRLRRSSSFEYSSASEAPRNMDPPITMPYRRLSLSPPVVKGTEAKSPESSPDFLADVDTLKLAHAKLQSEPGSAALKLMDCLFSPQELVNCNPSGTTKSKDPDRRRNIRPLDSAKINYISNFLESKWKITVADKGIKRKMTQKCRHV